MKLHDLRPAAGSTKKKRRVGRGISAGQGKTAGRGTKGQNSRSGGGTKPYFEGGQLPMVRRLPHTRGFTNIFREDYSVVNLGVLNDKFEANSTVTPELLAEQGMVNNPKRVKVLGDGSLGKALTIRAHAFSASAKQKIEAAGGKAEEITKGK